MAAILKDISLFLASLWTLPTTLLGWLLVLFSRTTYLGSDHIGSERCAEGGLAAWFFMRFGFVAITLGTVVVYSPKAAWSMSTIKHEERHIIQGLWFGPLSGPAYLIGWALAGFSYHDNWFERDARRHAGW